MNDAPEIDARDIPAYSYADAAKYVGVPASTVRSWVKGTTYTVRDGKKRRFLPVIERPDEDLPLLSFTNLVEIHVLCAIRNRYRVSLQKVRQALGFIAEQFPIAHPLARMDIKTDQVNLFVDVWGKILSVSGERGQVAIRRVVEAYLDRIERDEDGIANRLYPFTRPADERLEDQPRGTRPDDPVLKDAA